MIRITPRNTYEIEVYSKLGPVTMKVFAHTEEEAIEMSFETVPSGDRLVIHSSEDV